MYEPSAAPASEFVAAGGGSRADGSTSLGRLAGAVETIGGIGGNGSAAELIETVRLLEVIKAACAAAQAVVTRAFVVAQQADAAVRHADAEATRRSIAAQIALARRESRHTGGRLVGLATALVTEMPGTLAALRAGSINERRAGLVVEQFGCLTSADRSRADEMIARELPLLGDRGAQAKAAGIAARLDAEAVLGKVRGAAKDRHVSLRPAPDTMTRLSALLPVGQGVAVLAALTRATATATAQGDTRTRGQLMADELVSRVTGHALIGCDDHGVPRYRDTTPADGTNVVELALVMTDRALFGDDDEPAHVVGHGPIPAALARALLAGTATRTFLRRLYTDPVSGRLATMDTRRRLFPAAAQRFLIARDQMCRTPWCDAPIRHADHITGHAAGGTTAIGNAQGLCEACNHTKQAPGWRSSAEPGGTIRVTTPTGHVYPSPQPRPPISTPWPDAVRPEMRGAPLRLSRPPGRPGSPCAVPARPTARTDR